VRSHSSDAFILGTHALREKDRIVSFLTRDSGKKRGVARGARSPRSHFSGALEPMTEARVVYFEKDGRELVSIDEVEPIRPSFALSRELGQVLLLSSFAESLEVFVSDSDPAEPFYRLSRHAIDSLIEGAPHQAVAAYFDVWILKLSGLFPSLGECAGCGRTLSPEDVLLSTRAGPVSSARSAAAARSCASRAKPAKPCASSSRTLSTLSSIRRASPRSPPSPAGPGAISWVTN